MAQRPTVAELLGILYTIAKQLIYQRAILFSNFPYPSTQFAGVTTRRWVSNPMLCEEYTINMITILFKTSNATEGVTAGL